MSTQPTDSDEPGGDLTDHGADPAERGETGDAGSVHTEATQGEEKPGGDLTDHGVDPSSRSDEE